MKIFHVLGISGDRCSVEVEACRTVKQLQEALEAASGIPVREQRLLHGTTELRDRSAKLETLFSDEGACELTVIKRDPEQARWLQAVEEDFAGNRLQQAPQHIREDREVILAAMRRRPNAFKFAARALQEDRDFMLQVVRENKSALQFASRQLLADRELVLEACAHHGSAIQFASRELRSDHEIALAAAKNDAEALRYLGHELWSDRDFIIAAVQNSGLALKIASSELQGDQEVCLAAARNDGHALQFASPKLLEDRGFVTAAARISKYALRYASKQLQGDAEVVRAAVEADGGALCFAAQHIRGDREIALEAVKTCAEAVAFAARGLWTADFFLAAVEKNKEVLSLCPPQLKANRKWLLAAARCTDEALEFAAAELQDDAVFVLQILECGFESAVKHASPRLLGSADFVLDAARKSDSVLLYAAEELRADASLVRALVNKHGSSLQYASDALRAESTVALPAIIADPAAAAFVARELWSDSAFVAAALEESQVPPEFISEQQNGPESMSAAPQSGEQSLETAPQETTATCHEAIPQSRAEDKLQACASHESESSQSEVRASSVATEAPSPQAVPSPSRPRTPMLIKTSNGDSRREQFQVPCLVPDTPDEKTRGSDVDTDESTAQACSGNHRSATGNGHGGQFHLLPWVLPLPSEKRAPGSLIQSGLLSAALQIQTTQSEAESDQQQDAEDAVPDPEVCYGPLGSIDDVGLGEHLLVSADQAFVRSCCLELGLGLEIGEETWAASAGQYVKVLALDAMDGSIECRVPLLGDVWLPHRVLSRLPAETPLQRMGEAPIGGNCQVLFDSSSVLDACRKADLGSIENEADWLASAGKVVKIIGRDCKDCTVECQVPGIGDVWFALSALTVVQKSSLVQEEA